MRTRRETAPALDRLRACLPEEALPEIVSVYLFGSVAEDRAHAESDIDLGLVVDRRLCPGRAHRFTAALRLSAALQAALGDSRVEVVVLNDAPPLFARRIVLDGLRVYCRDLEYDLGFVRDLQLRAADVEPFLRRARATKMKALAPR